MDEIRRCTQCTRPRDNKSHLTLCPVCLLVKGKTLKELINAENR